MTQYFLCNYVHSCLTSDGAILLDLRRDEYLSLDCHQIAALENLVHGFPRIVTAFTTLSQPTEAEIASLLSALLEKGLVTTDAAAGRRTVSIGLEIAERSIVENHQVMSLRIFGYAARFLVALTRTVVSLRLRSPDKIFSAIEQRKNKQAAQSGRVRNRDVQELMNAFLLLRPLVYTERAKCLFDSIVLIHFLAAYQVFPSLVLGTRTRPFEAHAWVQEGRCALNSTAEYVRAFSPILVI